MTNFMSFGTCKKRTVKKLLSYNSKLKVTLNMVEVVVKKTLKTPCVFVDVAAVIAIVNLLLLQTAVRSLSLKLN